LKRLRNYIKVLLHKRGDVKALKKAYIKRRIIKSLLLFIVFVLVLLVNVSDFAFANEGKDDYTGSWLDDADKSIYGKDAEIQYDEDIFEEQKKDLGFIEEKLVELIMAITDSLYIMLDNMGITIDNVIYGRVGGHTKNGIALFKFELQKGNPYGVVGAAIYNIIAGISIVFIIVSLFGRFAIATYYKSGEKLSHFKSSVGTSILSIALLSLMPPFLDVALYIADAILYWVSSQGSLSLFATADGLNLVDAFREAAEYGIVNSLIYLGTILLSFYFAAVYTGYALTMVVLFIYFPIVCVGMNYDKSLLSQWIKQVISILLIPILDCTLMMIPIYLGLIPNGASMGILKIIICAMIIPSRNIIRQLLGLSGGSGLELTGVATMMGAMNLVRAGAGAINKFRGSKMAAKQDENMANYYTELSKNEGTNGSDDDGALYTGGPVGVGGGGGGQGIYMETDANSNYSHASLSGAYSSGKSPYYGNVSAEKYANIFNFENQAFKGKLSNEKLADLYRKRAAHRNASAVFSSLGSATGGVLGMGSGIFLGPGMSAQLGAAGIMLGGSFGEMMAERSVSDKSPIPTVYQRSAGNENEDVELVQGEVIEDVPLFDISKMETGAASYKDYEDQIFSFVRNNISLAANIADSQAKHYTANNGEYLKNIYLDIMKENGGQHMSNDQIRQEIRNRATDNVIFEFKTELNKKAVRENNELANQDGLSRIVEYANKRFRNKENGYFSDAVFDTFDWMPKNNQENNTDMNKGGKTV